jgi:hypothetical protein
VKPTIVSAAVGIGHFALAVAEGVLELARVLGRGGVAVGARAGLAIAAEALSVAGLQGCGQQDS